MATRILPYNSTEKPQDGDLWFIYKEEQAYFVAWEEPTDVDAPVGYDQVVMLQGEIAPTVIVAEVIGSTFRVYWWPSTNLDIGDVIEAGFRMKDEATARRHFPALQDLEFKGAK